ncbi:hypothetical protein JTE90_005434 [Oedothorax gibbosus]|uniref:Uncharacterized protein n=1 Tax=Oedothorax gibbosus TaxID=931172 RepID=A0AAV6TFN5_9ARAC|nr:hypothetical protein JTE90_005434 [Oedothorax gibbosus]
MGLEKARRQNKSTGPAEVGRFGDPLSLGGGRTETRRVPRGSGGVEPHTLGPKDGELSPDRTRPENLVGVRSGLT